MSTKIQDFADQAVLGASPFPASVSDTNNGDTVDLLAGDNACFAIQLIGAVGGTAPSLSGKIQESPDGTTWTDVANAVFAPVSASNNLQAITFQRTQRYVRHSRAVTGTTPSFVLGVLIGEQRKEV